MDKTAVYNVRLDIRSLAVLHRHYTKLGIYIPSIASLNRRSIEFLAENLVTQLGAEPFTSILDAVAYLEDQGMMKPLRNRGKSAILKGMQEESLKLDGLSPSYIEKKAKSKVSEDQVEKAREVLNQKQRESTSGAILGSKVGSVKEVRDEEEKS